MSLRQYQRETSLYEEAAHMVENNLKRDRQTKERILAGAPQLAHALDAGELEQMSSRELAEHELKQYGIKVSDASDPVEVRDAFHAGRMHERQRATGLLGSAQDSGGESFIDKYLRG